MFMFLPIMFLAMLVMRVTSVLMPPPLWAWEASSPRTTFLIFDLRESFHSVPFWSPSLSHPDCSAFAHLPCSITVGIAPCSCRLLFLRSIFCSTLFAVAEDLIWCSAQRPHPCEPGVRVRMWWREERKTEVRGTSAPPPSTIIQWGSGESPHTGGLVWQPRLKIVRWRGRTLQRESRCDTGGFFKLAAPSASRWANPDFA